MTVSHSTAPVLFRVLADPGGAPAALLLDTGGATLPSAVLDSPQLAALSAGLPCLLRTETHDPATGALEALGWRALDPAQLKRVDGDLATAMPGATWIDGDWCMAPPPTPQGARISSRALALQLVQLVAADADTHAIEALLRKDPALSYQLLRLVNSLGAGVGRRITSFAQALMILGRQQLRRWLNLMLFSARPGDQRSGMLLARVAVRARAMEQLARSLGLSKLAQEQAFMTGMFSLLGVLFGMSLTQLLAPLSLGEAVHAALLEERGDLAALLALVRSAEQGDFAALTTTLNALQLAPDAFNDAMLDATAWMLGTLPGGAHG